MNMNAVTSVSANSFGSFAAEYFLIPATEISNNLLQLTNTSGEFAVVQIIYPIYQHIVIYQPVYFTVQLGVGIFFRMNFKECKKNPSMRTFQSI